VTSAWWFVASVVGIVLTGVVLEVWQRRIVRRDMDRRREHHDLMREVRRHGPTTGPRHHRRIEPTEPRRRP
jgi:hypothetical protein